MRARASMFGTSEQSPEKIDRQFPLQCPNALNQWHFSLGIYVIHVVIVIIHVQTMTSGDGLLVRNPTETITLHRGITTKFFMIRTTFLQCSPFVRGGRGNIDILFSFGTRKTISSHNRVKNVPSSERYEYLTNEWN